MPLIYVLILMSFFILGNRGGYIHEISANISANKISLPQGQSYTEGKCYNGSKNLNLKIHKWLMIN